MARAPTWINVLLLCCCCAVHQYDYQWIPSCLFFYFSLSIVLVLSSPIVVAYKPKKYFTLWDFIFIFILNGSCVLFVQKSKLYCVCRDYPLWPSQCWPTQCIHLFDNSWYFSFVVFVFKTDQKYLLVCWTSYFIHLFIYLQCPPNVMEVLLNISWKYVRCRFEEGGRQLFNGQQQKWNEHDDDCDPFQWHFHFTELQ